MELAHNAVAGLVDRVPGRARQEAREQGSVGADRGVYAEDARGRGFWLVEC